MTIAVDASALVAILLDEPEKAAFAGHMLKNRCLLSPVGYWEATIRVRQLHGDEGVARLDRLISELDIEIAPASHTTAQLACEAETRFGKRTPARLNLGDCFAYALAVEHAAPLLYKGDDFIHTDVASATA